MNLIEKNFKKQKENNKNQHQINKIQKPEFSMESKTKEILRALPQTIKSK